MKHKNNLIIIIGREIGSGGRTIARLLAEKYGCQFYDREILNLAAKEVEKALESKAKES